jgi:hypothetical protein
MQDIIELAVAIELECAGLYEVFAKNFAGDAELVYFWKLYAEAERYHGATIRIHQAAFSDGVDPARLQVGSEDMLSLLSYIRENRTRYEREKPTVQDAMRIARRIEESSAELHGRTQFFKLHPSYAELFEKMAEEDRAHRDVLVAAEQKFTAQQA